MQTEYYFFENLFNLNMLTESMHLYEYFDITFERFYIKTIFLYLLKIKIPSFFNFFEKFP